jgi:enoyl-CoA hydratase
MTDPDQASELVHLTVERAIATITLDSPANRNALSAQLVGELAAHLATAGADDAVRAIVLTHTSNTFCAGADLAESAGEGGPAKGTARLIALLRQMLQVPKPVIVLVDGNVRAGGLGLLGAADLVYVSRASSFAFTEVRLGLAPAMISLTVLARLTDRAAARTFLTGSKFDAAEAARIGLVTAADDDPRAVLDEVLVALRGCSPQGLAATKALLNEAMLATFDERAEALAARSAELFASDEAAEGIASFLERRPPRWAS